MRVLTLILVFTIQLIYTQQLDTSNLTRVETFEFDKEITVNGVRLRVQKSELGYNVYNGSELLYSTKQWDVNKFIVIPGDRTQETLSAEFSNGSLIISGKDYYSSSTYNPGLNTLVTKTRTGDTETFEVSNFSSFDVSFNTIYKDSINKSQLLDISPSKASATLSQPNLTIEENPSSNDNSVLIEEISPEPINTPINSSSNSGAYSNPKVYSSDPQAFMKGFNESFNSIMGGLANSAASQDAMVANFPQRFFNARELNQYKYIVLVEPRRSGQRFKKVLSKNYPKNGLPQYINLNPPFNNYSEFPPDLISNPEKALYLVLDMDESYLVATFIQLYNHKGELKLSAAGAALSMSSTIKDFIKYLNQQNYKPLL